MVAASQNPRPPSLVLLESLERWVVNDQYNVIKLPDSPALLLGVESEHRGHGGSVEGEVE